MIILTLEAAQNLREAINYIVGYETDNSCGDPDCCGGPYYHDGTALEYRDELAALGIKIVD